MTKMDMRMMIMAVAVTSFCFSPGKDLDSAKATAPRKPLYQIMCCWFLLIGVAPARLLSR